MYGLEFILLIYITGITGSFIGGLIFHSPKNFKDLDFVMNRSIFWPHYAFALYSRQLERRADEIAHERVARLAAQLEQTKQILRTMTQSHLKQDARYDELLAEYAKVKELLELERERKHE